MANDTKEKILDAAERLFAISGFDGTSLRNITTAAGVNLAAVNYYFHSKDSLIQAVFERRLRPLNQRRLEMLDSFEASAGDGPLSIEDVLRAFFVPAFHFSRDLGTSGDSFRRLMGRIHSEPKQYFQLIFQKQFNELATRFLAACRRALPALPEVELLWRIHFMVGSMAHTLCAPEQLEVVSGGLCDLSNVEEIIERLIVFNAAAMRAPVVQAAVGEPL